MKLLVVIDMQNDFITGALGNKECRAVVPNVVEKVNNAVKTDTDIVITLDTHNDNYLETQEGINLPVKHCIKHSYGWKLIPELQHINPIKEFLKNTFGSIELANWIKENNYTDIELIGVCTDICVISNALTIKAVNPEARISVAALLCWGYTRNS